MNSFALRVSSAYTIPAPVPSFTITSTNITMSSANAVPNTLLQKAQAELDAARAAASSRNASWEAISREIMAGIMVDLLSSLDDDLPPLPPVVSDRSVGCYRFADDDQ